jgi:peptidoglycan/LPS O-acetylase OafA/YrhL
VRVRLGALDGLRGIAIALVLWFHVWQVTWLRADVPFTAGRLNLNFIPEPGFLGVDLFFFISGFCLFMPYADARLRGIAAPTLADFIYRRALKIVPSYVFAIFAMTALGLAHFGSFGEAAREIVLHLLFIHVWFPGSYGSINGVLWSLGVEVQFYVIFPVLAWCALRAPVATFAAMALVANAYRFGVRDAYDATHLINQLPGALDLFGAGMLAAYAHRTLALRAPLLANRRTLWTLVSLAGILLCYVICKGAFDARLLPNWPFRWLAVGRPLISLALPLVTLGALFAWPAWQRVFVNPVLVFLSLISYNLYLWHSAVAHVLLDAHVPRWRGADPHGDPAWSLEFTFVAFAASIGVAMVLTYGFERPLLRLRPFAPRSARKTSLAQTFETPAAITE